MPQRAELLQHCGADEVVVLPTSPAFLQLSATEFFEQVVRERLAARVVVEGYNFRFGRNREGTNDTLRELCAAADIGFVMVAPYTLDGQPVSSSRVRDALVRGQVDGAALLLGRPYHLSGTVIKGQRRGQTLGFPTANLEHIATLIPADGVYAVHAHHAAARYAGAANVGPNLTFGEQARKVEVHLIGYAGGDLYGQSLRIDFLERLRDTRRFGSAAELTQQLHSDVSAAARIAAP